jgi:hypothetical protein
MIHTAALGLALIAASASAHKHSAWRSGGISERIAVAGKVYVVPEAELEDSRCPAEVICVWAGRVVLKARVQFPDGAVPVTLTLGAPQAVGAGKLLLESVTPERGLETIAPQDYRFTFSYLPVS